MTVSELLLGFSSKYQVRIIIYKHNEKNKHVFFVIALVVHFLEAVKMTKKIR